MKSILLYALHSGNLYGTERMALMTLDGMRDRWTPLLLAPPGPVHEAAANQGIESTVFSGKISMLSAMLRCIATADEVAFCATGVVHSLAFIFCNSLFRRPFVHVHMVHGGTDEKDSYGRKRLLNPFSVKLVAVSEFVRERLLAHGAAENKITVIENFLPDSQIQQALRRKPFAARGIRKILVVSRVDPIKRLDLMMDALDREHGLRDLEIRVLGTGWDLEAMRKRAKEFHPNVHFAGYSTNVEVELANADLLLHLCPVEPFGLAILEALAAGIPVLLPDQGGASSLIEDQISGYHFQANNVDDLIRLLLHLREAEPGELNDRVEQGFQRLNSRYAGSVRLNDYRALFGSVKSWGPNL